MLEGKNFTIYTDHKPLIYAFKQKPEKASPRQARHLDFIAQFSTDIRHIPGKNNVVADTLSRLETISVPDSLNYEELSSEQANDDELQDLLNNPDKHSLQLIAIQLPDTETTIYCDTSTKKARPFIPNNMRKSISFNTQFGSSWDPEKHNNVKRQIYLAISCEGFSTMGKILSSLPKIQNLEAY